MSVAWGNKALWTAGEIQKAAGMELHHFNYIVARHGIEPETRAGIVRLYTPAQAERIESERARTIERLTESRRSMS